MSILWFQIATTEFLKASEKKALILAENLSALYWNNQDLLNAAHNFLQRGGKISILHYGELDKRSDMTAFVKQNGCVCERLSTLNWRHSLVIDAQEYPALANFIVYDNKRYQYNHFFLSDKATACANDKDGVTDRLTKWFHHALSQELALREKLPTEQLEKLRAESNEILQASHKNMGRLIACHDSGMLVKRQRAYGVERTNK